MAQRINRGVQKVAKQVYNPFSEPADVVLLLLQGES